jgi:DNA gyrase subunit B/topoisomerase-4 subunit B
MSSDYGGSSIKLLRGLEAVRKRPGMYIGGTGSDGLHHLLWEIVDNSVDEAMNGHASKIVVTLEETGQSCVVSDNGRGIPVEMHPEEKKSTLEVVLTELHAGGKFEGDSYKTSGGLHGVGASVVNALSHRLEARVRRRGHEWTQSFKRGRPLAAVAKGEPCRGTGTTIRFEPDPEIFEDVEFNAERIRSQLEIKTYLNRGLRIVFKDKVGNAQHDLHHEGGVRDYLRALVSRKGLRAVLAQPFELGARRTAASSTWSSRGPRPPARASSATSTASPPSRVAPMSRACATRW